jgi:hypothetical protein
VKRESSLDGDKQTKLASLIMKHGEDWKSIQSKMGFRSKREAIMEFLRLPLDNDDYLVQSQLKEQKKDFDFKNIEPYNQMEQL